MSSEKLLSKYIDAVRKGDAEQLSGLFAENGWLISPEIPPIKGRKAIKENYEENLGEGFEVENHNPGFSESGRYGLRAWLV